MYIKHLITSSLCLISLTFCGMAQCSSAQDLQLIEASLPAYQDFPKPGIKFYDVSGILKNPVAFKKTIDILVEHYRGQKIDAILALDARGFLFATPVAYQLNIPVVMLRKPGKLPGTTISTTLSKEYGTDTIEMQTNALLPKQRVIIIDDLVATGGTLRAAIKLARQAQTEVIEVASIIELTEFENSRNLDVPVYSVIKK